MQVDLFFEIHQGLTFEAPGSDEATLEALSHVPALPSHPRILDVGCGPGRQTLLLARKTGGHITAVDTHQSFLDVLLEKARDQGLSGSITALNRSMIALDFEPESFELIWSEGAAYIMGFENALRSWRRFLKPGGSLALTECVWLTDRPAPEVRDFWQSGYPAMTSVGANLALIRTSGYEVIHHFTLPESAWWNYYTPMRRRIEALRAQYAGDAEAARVLDGEEAEIQLFERYAGQYGYEFFVMRKARE
ncbi:MAG: methyltransferase domain-containing protein [Myxococcaceae bacterium]|nr:methyltransferase domain-containing protein [Myxococcaceae bacterium]